MKIEVEDLTPEELSAIGQCGRDASVVKTFLRHLARRQFLSASQGDGRKDSALPLNERRRSSKGSPKD